MAAEVARLRERMSGLGIAILPRASSGALDTAALKSQSGDDAPAETASTGEKEAESGVASPPLAGPWMVSDRAGKAVPPPVRLEDALGGHEGVNGPQALPEQANVSDVGAPETPVGEARKAEGGVLTQPQKVQHQSTKMERTDSVGGQEAQTEGVQTTPLFSHRTSPWASHTNPLFDVDHSKGDSLPFPATSLGPRFGATASTAVSTLLVTAHQAPRMAASGESEAFGDEASGLLQIESSQPEEKRHVEARHEFPRRGSPTPPAERSQSPDLDHDRAQKSDPPIEPLILDHTKRNAAQAATRNDARFDSPSLSEGIPTLASAQSNGREQSASPPSDISFPRLLQQETPPSPQVLPTLDFSAVSDSDDEGEILQPVALSVDGERMFRMPSRDAKMPEDEEKWGDAVVLPKKIGAEAASRSERDAGLRKVEDDTETGEGREAGSSEIMTGATAEAYPAGRAEVAAKTLESGLPSPLGTLLVPQQDHCLVDSGTGSGSANANIPFKEQENEAGAVSTEEHRLESAANGCHTSEHLSESPEQSVASSAGQTTHAPIYSCAIMELGTTGKRPDRAAAAPLPGDEAPGLGVHTAGENIYLGFLF
jgi:hypothetical protein